jgi:amino acid adenylation domain-containing protein
MKPDSFVFPTSFAQQRLWFLDQLEPNSPLYNLPVALRLRGPLKRGALQQSLNEIVRRHEALRTTFSVVDGLPVQVIAPVQTISLPLVDLRHLPETERQVEARRLAQEDARHPFDLAQGPLLRTTLLRLDEQDHVLLLNMHHIVTDGWSMGLLFHELSTLYEAFCLDRPSPLPDLPIQYADYSVWQRDWLQGEVLEEQLAYWREQLADAPTLLAVPTARPRTPAVTYQAASQALAFPRPLSEALRKLSQREGVTPFMTLLAAFQTLLYRYTQQEDVVVGSPIANRSRAEIERLIGFFVNTLVLRTDLSSNPTFRELLRRVREVCLGAYAHQDLPFERLVEELQPERNLGHSPLFQVMFILQNAPRHTLEIPGMGLSYLPVDTETMRFDLVVSLAEEPAGLRGGIRYKADLFDTDTIRRMAGHFQTLLEAIVADPDQTIATLPLLTSAERHQLLVGWNDTQADYPRDRCVHQLFEAQVQRALDAIAVAADKETLTYRELNCRANQLAHYLRSLGVGPERLVGICLHRSVEWIVAVLGIFKAGGAYLPLDPDYPTARLAFLTEDAHPSLIVTNGEMLDRLSRLEARIVCLDREQQAIARESQENPDSGVTTANLAYVIYTSGSTGRPKGVMVEHRGLVNMATAQNRYYDLRSGSRLLHFGSTSFDGTGGQIARALSAGATLQLAANEISLDGARLVQLVRDSGVTHVGMAPSALAILPAEELPAVQVIGVGGDVCPLELAGRWAPGRRFFNFYGPTEATVIATHFECEAGDPTVLIGRPIANMQVYLLDAHLQPLPIGLPGELCIGGVGLARGYLNRPDLTAEKFIPNPFSAKPGARLYQTGDLARYRPDGNIEFLGRLDHQVKIRGFRVELGEIETMLGQHPAVKQTAVLASQESTGDRRLVAYVVAGRPPAPTVPDLRRFLKEKLPEYMIPSAFVFLEALPVLPSGKVNRQALPAPDKARPELEEAFVSPRSPTERALAGIWAQVLGLEQVGVHDSFFELGGHSLLATQVVSRVRQALHLELPVRSLFEEPTIAGWSRYIEAIRWAAEGSRHPPEDQIGDWEVLTL